MADWDIDAESNVGYEVRFYCTRCQEFYTMSPIAPTRCPMCFCDRRYIIGPIPANVYDMDYIRKAKKKSEYKDYYNE